MATFSTKKRPDEQVNSLPTGTTTVFHKIDPSTLASYPAAGDDVEFFDLPENCRIVDASIRVSADIGAATSTVQLRAGTTALTAALAATAAGSARMNVAPPVRSSSQVSINVLVGTAALDAAGDIEVMIQYVHFEGP